VASYSALVLQSLYTKTIDRLFYVLGMSIL